MSSFHPHYTRSINCLLRGPQSYQISDINYLFISGHNQSFSPAGSWGIPGINLPFLFITQDNNGNNTLNSSVTQQQIDDSFGDGMGESSLITKHGQARWLEINVVVTVLGTAYAKYDHDSSHTDSAGTTYSGQPEFRFPTFNAQGNPNPNAGDPTGPCEMSTFGVGGRNRGYGVVYNQFGGQSQARRIEILKPYGNTDFSPISIGPSAGL